MSGRSERRCPSIGPDGRHLVGDPIDVVSGANRDTTFDFSLPGTIPIVWARHYDSGRHDVACSLGWGHAHAFEHELAYTLEGFRYRGPSGERVDFPPLAHVGGAVAASGWRLMRTADSRYLLRRRGRPALEFIFARGAVRTPLSALVSGAARAKCIYDARGRLERIETPERALFIEHDEAGRLTRITVSDSPTAPARVLIAYGYDGAGNLVIGEDAYGRRFSFGYDAERRMVRRTDRRGYTFTWEYDGAGRCVHSRGEDGVHEVWLRYEPEEMRTRVRRGDGGEWAYLYDEGGIVRAVVDPYGGVSQFRFDDAGRVAEEIDGTGASTRWVYDPAGALLGRVSAGGEFVAADAEPRPRTPAELRDSRPVGWEWGTLARWLGRRRGVPGAEQIVALPAAVRSGIDPGMCTRQPEIHQHDHAGVLVGVRRGEEWRRRFAYDANGSVARIIDAEGRSFQYGYESWDFWTVATDPMGRALRMRWTPTERLMACSDAGGATSGYEHDLKDRLVRVWRHGGTHIEYRYDGGDRVIGASGGDGQPLWSAERDDAGRVVRIALASGTELTYGYDDGGRPSGGTGPGGATLVAWHPVGRRAADLHDGCGVVHELDAAGALRATTYLDRFEVAHRRATAHARSVRDPRGTAHRFEVLGTDVALRAFGNGTSELVQYREDGRCALRAVWTRGNGVPWVRSYAHSAEGNLLVVRDSRRGVTRYGYDAAHRLVQMLLPDGTSHEFAYDAGGNLLRQPGLDGVRVGEGNRLAAANGATFTYDARARIAERKSPEGTTSYRYDEFDMLLAVDGPGLAWRAVYDPYRRRVSKTVNGRTTRYRWDGDRLAAELRDDGTIRIYVYVDAAAWTPFMFLEYESVEAPPESGLAFFIHADHRATPVLVTDQAGETVWRARIEPYGRAHVEPGARVEMPLRFPGHYHDVETGLHYNRYRYYSPELGRYLQPDPSGQAGGANLYAYAANPLKRVDVRGLCPTTQPAGTELQDDEPTLVTARPPAAEEPEVNTTPYGDARVLVDDAINGGAIVLDPNASPEFHAGARQDLETMAGTPTGAGILNRVMDNHDTHGTTVTIAPLRSGDHPEYGGIGPHCEATNGDPRVGPRGESGTPSDSTVRYTPGDDRPVPQSQGGSPSDAILTHEMYHASTAGAGEDMSGHPPGVARNGNAEEQSAVTTENKYREERGGVASGYPPRDGWDHLP